MNRTHVVVSLLAAPMLLTAGHLLFADEQGPIPGMVQHPDTVEMAGGAVSERENVAEIRRARGGQESTYIPPSPYIGAAPTPEIEGLRAEYRRLEQDCILFIAEVRAVLAGRHKPEMPRATKGDLTILVQETFDARQQLQRAELAEFRRQLGVIEKQINDRQLIKDEIVEHRVKELLDPNLKWDSEKGDLAATPAPNVKLAGTPSAQAGSHGAPNALLPRQQPVMRAQSVKNLKKIGVAMSNFHDSYGRLPAAAARTSKTRRPTQDNPPHSWRVALLPFVDQQHLYGQYRFDQPWNSPENLKVLEQMPPVYRNPKAPPGTTKTSYFALTGPATVFSGEEGTPFREIRDGTSNTLAVVEAKRSVPWTKPEDIPYDVAGPIPNLGGHIEGGFMALFCDGAVKFIPESVEETVLRGLISRDGRELVGYHSLQNDR